MKSRCHNCRKKIGLLGLNCSYCNHKYCSGCIQLEQHECSGIEKCVEEHKNKLKERLDSATYSKKEKLFLSDEAC